MFATFNRFELEMTLVQALSVSKGGPDATEKVEVVLQDKKIAAQLDAIGFENIRDELKEYGAWNDDELTDDDANCTRIVCIAGGNIREALSHNKP